MTPKVSIVIPIYNVEAYVGDCIQSVLSQTFTDWEAICVNDASTDNSLARAEETIAADPRFRIINHDVNQGLSAARNTGLAHAKGEYVLFLDSDDMYVPHALERLVDVAGRNDLEVLDFNAEAFFEEGIDAASRGEAEYLERPNIEGIHSGPELFTIYNQQDCYRPPAPFHFIKRVLIEETGLKFKQSILHEDELFSPLLHAHAKRAMFLNERLYLYRIRSSSIVTKKRGVKNVAGLFVVTQELERWLNVHANEYNPDYIEAFKHNVWVLRQSMARDILNCTGEDIVLFEEGLTPEQRTEFERHGIQMAIEIERKQKSWKTRVRTKLKAIHDSLPKGLSRLAVKRNR